MKIRVEFEVPDDIARGLTNGTLERVGGVIRFADSKQIVAWLRDGGNMSRTVSSGSQLLPALLQAAGMNARTVAVVTGAVTVAGPLLDVAIVGYTIYRLNERIEALKREIEEIYDRIDRHFARAESAALQTALQLANELLDTEDLDLRREKVNDIIARLVHAEKLLLMDLDDALDGNRRRKAAKLIDTIISVDMLAARCSFDVGEEYIATARLDKNRVDLKPRIDRLIHRLLGKQPALYFHKSVKDEYLNRYIQIRAWLYGDEDVWERTIKEARKGFWNEKAIKRLYRVARRFLYTWPKLRKKPFYINAIPRAELIIENYQRFESFALIVSSPHSPLRDLEIQSEEAAKRLADHDDYVLLIDEDAIGRVQALSA